MKPGHLMSGDFSYSPIKWYIFSIKNCSLLLKCIWFSVLHQPHNQTELPFHFMSCIQPNAVVMLFVFLKESGIDWFLRNTIVEMNIYCRRTKKAKRTGSLSLFHSLYLSFKEVEGEGLYSNRFQSKCSPWQCMFMAVKETVQTFFRV